jgi:hypothetical protein
VLTGTLLEAETEELGLKAALQVLLHSSVEAVEAAF